MWVVDITKNTDHSYENSSFNHLLHLASQQRNQMQIDACCNTCERLAMAAAASVAAYLFHLYSEVL